MYRGFPSAIQYNREVRPQSGSRTVDAAISGRKQNETDADGLRKPYQNRITAPGYCVAAGQGGKQPQLFSSALLTTRELSNIIKSN